MVDFANGPATLGIIGAGAMGQGIAQVAIAGGLTVRLFDLDDGARDKAAKAIDGRLARNVEKDRMSQADKDAAMARLHLAGAIGDLADCDAVVEAVVEDVEVKRRVFTELEGVVGEGCLLASNTSSIPIAKIARPLTHRGRVAGLHFFNPVPLMKLVEVVAAPETAAETLDQLEALGRRLGREPVQVKDTPGFLVNLAGRAYITEALHILHEGVATPAQIDRVMRDCCGYRMGPFELMDLTGIDVNYPVSMTVYEGFFHDQRLRTTPGHAALFNAGRLGRKTGAGWHDYDEAGQRVDEPAPPPAPAAEAATSLVLLVEDPRIIQLARQTGVTLLDIDDGESPIVAALPRGRDATQAAFDTGVDPTRLVALDTEFDTTARMTLMVPPGGDPACRDRVAAWLLAAGVEPEVIQDSPGFIAQRIQAMVVNLGAEIAQAGLAAPADIDRAVKLGLNYPNGPLELADHMGPGRVYDMLVRLQQITGDDRYRPSLWLRRRALLGLSALEE